MRKTLKSALSVVLSAAMALTMGSVGSLTNNTSAKAADMGPNFTASLWSYGTFQDWVADPAASVTVTAGGEYTLSGEATKDLDDLFATAGSTVITFGEYDDLVATGLNQEGGYKIVGKSIQINDGAAIAWPGEVIKTKDEGTSARMYIYNGWEAEGNVIPAGTVQPIKVGDKISVTFEVQTGEAPADPTAAPSDATEAPTADPTPGVPSEGKLDFNATIKCYGNFYGWDGDTPTDATATTHVSDYGEYSVSFVAPDAFADLNEMTGAFVVQTDLTGDPSAQPFALLAKTVKIGENSYDWSKAVAYLDGDNIRMSARNEWGTEDHANPLAGQVIPINKDDVITFTFEVKEGAPAPVGPLDFNAIIKCYGNFYGWDGDTPTDATATTHVSNYGEYSVSFEAPDAFSDLNEMTGAFVVETDLKGEPSTHPFTLLAKTIKIGENSYDWSKATAYLDGENIRMSARNEWGQEPHANPLEGQVIPINKGDVVTFTFEVKEGGPAGTPTEAPTEAPTAAPAQSYNAYLSFQTDAWDYRNEFELDHSSKVYDFETQAVVGEKPTDVNKVKIKNAEIKENGTYSISITGADLSAGKVFNMLYISTDIPVAMKDVKFTDLKVIIDGAEVGTLKEGLVKKEVLEGQKKYYMVMAINCYGVEGLDLPEALNYSMPKESVELQFTVSGLDFGQDYSTKTYGAKKGTTFTSGNFKYKVTKAATTTAGKIAKGKVEVVGLSAAGKKKTSVSVGTSVKYTSNKEKATYTISSLGAGAFKGASKLKAVTLSKNIKSIKKDVFKNCKNLSKLTLKAKLSSVAKNSFKGCKKTIKVSGTSAKANVKKLANSGYKKFK